jgi:hypothetical protein
MLHRKEYVYLISCPDEPWWTNEDPGELINEMTDTATDVTYETMVRHCEGLIDWALSKGYDRRRDQGLTLKDDSYVTFNRGLYDEMRCYFVQWSGIEFIWVHKMDLREHNIEAPIPPWQVEEAPRQPGTWWAKEPW